MKKLLLGLMAIAVSCSLLADTKNYEITWDLPVESGLMLNVYVWSGIDTTLCPFFPNYPLDQTSEFFRKQVDPSTGLDNVLEAADGSTYFSVMGQYFKPSNNKLGNTAWATVGNTSSHFRLTDDLDPPEDVQNLQVQE